MNDLSLDRELRDVFAQGPRAVPSTVLDRAMALAAATPQRRPRFRSFDLQAWPPEARSFADPAVRRSVRGLVATTIVVLLLATVIAVGALLLRQPSLGGGGWITVSATSIGLHVLAPDGATDRTFTRAYDSCPRLSPDGTAVAYLIRFHGFYVTRLDDISHQRVAEYSSISSFGYKEGVWSPDRTRLAFRANSGSAQVFNVLSAFDGSIATVFSTTTDELVGEAWSPDSTRVAIAHARAGQLTIDIVDLAGVVQHTIGPFPGGAELMSMAWSPDGRRLVYVDATVSVLMVVDLATGARRALSTPAVGVGPYSWPEASPWSPDGEWIAVADVEGNVQIISVDGVMSTPVPMPQGITTEINWSPTANFVAFGDQTGLMVVHADGSRFNEIDLRKIGDSNTWNFAWSPDGSRIVVAENRGASGGVEVTSLDASGRSAPIPIANYPTTDPDDLCVSWDAASTNP